MKTHYNGSTKKIRSSQTDFETEIQFHITYIFGRLQKEIEVYAQSIGVPASVIADKVGELLHAGESREILGIENSLSSVRGNPTPYTFLRKSKVEMDDRSRESTQNRGTLGKKKHLPILHCPDCNRPCRGNVSLAAHKRATGHGANQKALPKPPKQPVTSERFQCPDCKLNCENGTGLAAHARHKHGVTRMKQIMQEVYEREGGKHSKDRLKQNHNGQDQSADHRSEI